MTKKTRHAAIKANTPPAAPLPARVSSPPLDRRDYIIMAALTLIYLVVALVNLGRLDSPTTGWKPVKVGEGFVADLGLPKDISRIYYYSGLGDGREASGRYKVEFMDASGKYLPYANIEKKEIFTWKYLDLTPVRTGRMRITADAPGGTLLELGFFEKGKTTPVSVTKLSDVTSDPADEGVVANLFDEQGSIEYRPSYLSDMIFDEIYHVRTAYEYIHHIEPFENSHPPLGKELIALCVLVFGMVPFGWRIAGTLGGAAMLPAMYVFGRRMFGGRFYGFAAAFLMMADFMHFSQTRVGTVDGFVTLFIMLMFYYMYRYYSTMPYETGPSESLRLLFLCGLFFGLGAATKWNALYGAPGLLLLFVLAKRAEHKDAGRLAGTRKSSPWFLWCVLFFVVVPAVIYTLSYIPIMMVPGPGHSIADLPAIQGNMYNFHKTLVATHPFQSLWWEWPLMLKPVWFYVGSDMPAGMTSTIVSFGNPAIWWVGIPAVAAAVVIAAVRRDRDMVVVFTAIASLYLPWTQVTRIAFIYHFFPILPFVILCIVYVLKNIVEGYSWGRYAAWGYLTFTLLLFVLFYPALSGMEVSLRYIEHLKWLKGWYF